MSVYLFIGPTIPVAEASAILDGIYLPPAAQGDVYRAALCHPQAIGIVDGLFDAVPSIWHKEILWAMSQGIHVFGSASMGALRAAELAAFGMEGVGAIFQAYAAGERENDDDVAVLHGSVETGYRPFSEALVNIRATLVAAAANGVIPAATADALLDQAGSTFYADRSYQRLLQDAARSGLPDHELAALRDWLPHNRIDQKRIDAQSMLRVMRERLDAGLVPKRVSYYFEHTVFWDRAVRAMRPLQIETPHKGDRDQILDELRLNPPAYGSTHALAVGRGLAHALAKRQGYLPDPNDVRQQIEDFRRTHDLQHGQAMDQWLALHDLHAEQLSRLMYERAQLTWAAERYLPDIAGSLLDELALDARYRTFRNRAQDKQRILEALGQSNPSLLDTGLSRDAILNWFFLVRMRQPIPNDLWLYLRALGYPDEDTFIRAIVREYHYTCCGEEASMKGTTYD